MSNHPPEDRGRFEKALLGELLAVQGELGGSDRGQNRSYGPPRRGRNFGLVAAALLVIGAGSAIGTGLFTHSNSNGSGNSATLDAAYLTNKALHKAGLTKVEYVVTTVNGSGTVKTVELWRYRSRLKSQVLAANGSPLRALVVNVHEVGGVCEGTGAVEQFHSKTRTPISVYAIGARPVAIGTVAADIETALSEGELHEVGDTTLHGHEVIELQGTMRMGELPGVTARPLAICATPRATVPAPAGSGSGNSGASGGTGGTGTSGSSGTTGVSGNTGTAGSSGNTGTVGTPIPYAPFSRPPLVDVILWVDPHTYLPVQAVTHATDGESTTTSTFSWLAPSSSNLAQIGVKAMAAAQASAKAARSRSK
jgi:hypothetical protein